MKCIIVEDDKVSATHLKSLLENHPLIELSGIFSSVPEASNYLKKEKIDLIFLDIQLPGESGFDLLRNTVSPPLFIITSSFKHFGPEAYEFHAVDYLLKPLQQNRLNTAIQKADEKLFSTKTSIRKNAVRTPDYVFVRCNTVLTKIRIQDINYIQAAGDYVNIYTRQKRFTVHITLRGIEEKLPANKFYRLHRSYLVALDQVDAIEEGTAYLEKHPIPIGEQYKKELLKKLNLI
jgi:two-component system, LytTR family, response regulator